MDFIPQARTVLIVIRKPTAYMMEAARPEIFKVDAEGYRPSATSLAETTFVAMMDAALAEGQPWWQSKAGDLSKPFIPLPASPR